jgi:hypothetical protein
LCFIKPHTKVRQQQQQAPPHPPPQQRASPRLEFKSVAAKSDMVTYSRLGRFVTQLKGACWDAAVALSRTPADGVLTHPLFSSEISYITPYSSCFVTQLNGACWDAAVALSRTPADGVLTHPLFNGTAQEGRQLHCTVWCQQ